MNGDTPNNFSWLEEHKIAGLAYPHTATSLEYLVLQGIGYLVTTCKEMQPCLDNVPSLVNVNISVEDYGTFNLEQVNEFIEVCKKALSEGKVIRFVQFDFIRLKEPIF